MTNDPDRAALVTLLHESEAILEIEQMAYDLELEAYQAAIARHAQLVGDLETAHVLLARMCLKHQSALLDEAAAIQALVTHDRERGRRLLRSEDW